MSNSVDELTDLKEHLDRYRAVTLQVLDMVSDEDLSWRPSMEQYSLGQQLLHIAQSEAIYVKGLFEGEWDWEVARFPKSLPDRANLQEYFREVRERTDRRLKGVTSEALGRIVPIPGSPIEATLRSWLWFILEHEIHHKGQVWQYLRQMGYSPPFYAMPLPPGERPDHKAREDLGGF
jgi:uncharacterized damage-inducible protein DinB